MPLLDSLHLGGTRFVLLQPLVFLILLALETLSLLLLSGSQLCLLLLVFPIYLRVPTARD